MILVFWFCVNLFRIKVFSCIYVVVEDMICYFLFSSFSTPTLSGLFTFGVYVAGHLAGDIINHLNFAANHGSRLPDNPFVTPFTEKIIKGVYYVIPNLENFNIRARVVYNLPIGENYVLYTTFYGLTFIGIYLLIASLWFGKRDFI